MTFLIGFICNMQQALRCYSPRLDAINADQQSTSKQNSEPVLSYIITKPIFDIKREKTQFQYDIFIISVAEVTLVLVFFQQCGLVGL